MSHKRKGERSHHERPSRQIECLACGASRATLGTTAAETGECPRCGYLGWAFSDQLDWTTQRLILNGRLAQRRPLDRVFGAGEGVAYRPAR